MSNPERNEFHHNGRVFVEERYLAPGRPAMVLHFIDGEPMRERDWYAAIHAARRADKEAGR